MTVTTTTTQLPTGTWTIDPSHSAIEFSVRHLMIAKVKGAFKSFSGSVTVPEDPYQASVQVSIDPTSIDTGDAGRDNHLRSADFFEVEKYPVAEYVSSSVRPQGEGYVVDGQLTLHGVTRPVTLDLEFNGVGGDPWGNTRAGFTAT
ncbi:MAG TPA: YceI family protein, partial [Acidimicrobiales bacterium]